MGFKSAGHKIAWGTLLTQIPRSLFCAELQNMRFQSVSLPGLLILDPSLSGLPASTPSLLLPWLLCPPVPPSGLGASGGCEMGRQIRATECPSLRTGMNQEAS